MFRKDFRNRCLPWFCIHLRYLNNFEQESKAYLELSRAFTMEHFCEKVVNYFLKKTPSTPAY